MRMKPIGSLPVTLVQEKANFVMKPSNAVLAVHKTFEKDATGKRDVVLFTSDGSSLTKVKKITGDTKIANFIESIPAGSTVRFTAVVGDDRMLRALRDRGVTILFAHWHHTEMDMSLPPEEIAYWYANVGSSVLREFVPREELVRLRGAVISRNALLMFYGDAVRRLKQVARNQGDAELETEELAEDLSALGAIKKMLNFKDEDGKSISWDRRVENLAKDIPECVLFAKVAGFTSLGTAAAIVAYSNGLDRFPDVASFWAYCGQGVVDGLAPKRKKGSPVNWSPVLRTTVHNMMESINKQTGNPWNAKIKEYKEAELAVHLEKHPGCKAPLGHSFNRAKRKVAKEILKRFFLAATSKPYEENHISIKPFTKNLSRHMESENQTRVAA